IVLRILVLHHSIGNGDKLSNANLQLPLVTLPEIGPVPGTVRPSPFQQSPEPTLWRSVNRDSEHPVFLVQLLKLLYVPRTLIDEKPTIDLVNEWIQPLGNGTHPLLFSDLQHQPAEVLSAWQQVSPPSFSSDNIAGNEYWNPAFLSNTRREALASAWHSDDYDNCLRFRFVHVGLAHFGLGTRYSS